MNIIINGFHNQSHFRVISKLCTLYGVKYLAHVYSKEIYQFPKNIKADLFSWDEVLYSADYGLDFESLTPLSGELISKMRECEAVAINMMDRMEKYRSYSYNERREIYLKHLKVWSHIIDSRKIDLYISSNIPHLVHDYVVYELCRLKNIPTIILKQSQVEGSFVVFNDWRLLRPELKERYSRYLKKGEIKLLPNFDKHFLLHTGQRDTTPFYMKKIPPWRRLFKWLRSVFQEKNWRGRLKFGPSKLFTSLKISLTTKFLMHYYESISQDVDMKNKYIYLPLHFQPEMTTMPCADAFSDQRLIVDLLSSVLPKGYYIYVKENPKQTSMIRTREYYRQMSKNANVRFVSRKVNTFELIKHCQAVATATGTAGWEALFRGKPVLMFGHDFYQYAPGVFRIISAKDATEAINSIKKKQNIPTISAMKAFLKALESVSVSGYVDESYRHASGVSLEENEENIFVAISSYMKDLGYRERV